MPSPSTTKIHGSDRRPHSSVAGAACSCWFASSTGCSWPSVYSSDVRLDVDERHVGVRLGDRLDRIERRAAQLALAERRRGEDERERLVRRERIRHGCLVERGLGLVVGRDTGEVAVDVRRGRRVRRRCRIADLDRRRRVGHIERHPDLLGRDLRRLGGDLRAPHAGMRQVGIDDVHAALVGDRPHELALGRCHGRVGIGGEVVERNRGRAVRRADDALRVIEEQEDDPRLAAHDLVRDDERDHGRRLGRRIPRVGQARRGRGCVRTVRRRYRKERPRRRRTTPESSRRCRRPEAGSARQSPRHGRFESRAQRSVERPGPPVRTSPRPR